MLQFAVSFYSLGVSHDSQGASAACPNLVNIMSTVGEKGPGSWEWSSCSKENIQNFLMYVISWKSIEDDCQLLPLNVFLIFSFNLSETLVIVMVDRK